MIDLQNARKVFNRYVNKYDVNDPKVALKIAHTYRVMDLSKQVAESLALSQEEVDLASLIGLLHDIGRFEQLKRYNSFIDSITIDHALLGVNILFDDGLIKEFDLSVDDYQLVKQAIFNHNKYQIATDLSERELLHCKIIRDSDKVDIFNTGLIESFEAFLDVDQETLENDVISLHIYETYMNSETILSTTRKTNLDRWVSFLALIFDLNYQYSCNYVYQQDFINRLVSRLQYHDPKTCKQMQMIREHGNEYLRNRSNI